MIKDKLNLLLNTKEEIKAAIIRKGQTVADTDPFSSYPTKIDAIETGISLPTLTNPATAAELLAPKQLIDADGKILTGTMPTKTTSDLTVNGATVTVPAGYYNADASKAIASATQAAPTITISSAGLVTASSTQAAGYVTAGTKSATKQLTTQAATTITPGTAAKTAVAAGTYTTGAIQVAGASTLIPSNIKSGVSIFGVTGALTPGGRSWSTTSKYTSTCGPFTYTCGFTPIAAMIVLNDNPIDTSNVTAHDIVSAVCICPTLNMYCLVYVVVSSLKMKIYSYTTPEIFNKNVNWSFTSTGMTCQSIASNVVFNGNYTIMLLS